MDFDTPPREHLDEGIDTEAMKASPHEIVHKVGADAEVLRLQRREPEIAEDVARALLLYRIAASGQLNPGTTASPSRLSLSDMALSVPSCR